MFEHAAYGLNVRGENEKNYDIKLFPYNSRLFSTGNAGDFAMLDGDLMFPIIGNSQRIIYVDTKGKIGQEKSWLGSFGGGFRQIVTQKILGAYLFFDRSSTFNQSLFSVINPGIEAITNRWDIHLNGYFPLKSEQTKGLFFAEQVGVSSFVVFSGHNEFDHILECFEEVGNGIDMEVGKTWLKLSNLRTYLGGYYYSLKELNAIKGIQTGVQYPLNQNLMLGFNYSYDNVQKNVVSVSLRLSFGYPARSRIPDIHERMLDPIVRHLGTLNTGSGIPSEKGFRDTTLLEEQLVNDKIWFFSPTGSPFNPVAGFNNCTYENPCNIPSFNQNNVNDINNLQANAVLFFAPATYPIINMFGPVNRITLNDGQSMFGRTSDFLSPAPTANRPLFIGGFDLTGNNILSDLNFSGMGTIETIGIQSVNADDLSLINLNVSDYVGPDGVNPGDAGGDAIGILMSDGQNIQILNVIVSDIIGGRGANGLNGVGGADANADGGGSIVAVAGIGGQGTNALAAGAGGNAIGILFTNVSVDLNQVMVNQISGGMGGQGAQGGIGGSANATNGLVNNATSAAGLAGTGGNGGDGSNGGSGGKAIGIQMAGSTGNINMIQIENITGGAGGMGGEGGRGGDANANGNDNQNVAGVGGLAGGASMFNSLPTGGGGDGGASGNGGDAGDAVGLSLLAGSSFEINNTSIMFLNGGIGGVGAVGANGGNANANDNLAGGGDAGGSVYSGGTGGQGGGNGALGGTGGNGGVGGIAGGGTLAGGVGGQGGGFAGNGGNNGIGGKDNVASLNGSTIVLGGISFSSIQGGNGAGTFITSVGGQGGSALSSGNMVGPNTNGNGGNGGSTNGIPSSNPPATLGIAGAIGGFGNPTGGLGGAGGTGQLGGFIP
ncbi:MAG: inverse autotransporter beta domain-containing protein [Gammaproteobacteria bacterium]